VSTRADDGNAENAAFSWLFCDTISCSQPLN